MIDRGIVYEDDVFYEFGGEGVFASGDAALDAEEIGTRILNVLERKAVQDCREVFSDDAFFGEFQQQDWGQLEAGWTANRYYDCYYTYVTESQGYVGYTYYIYPDFDRMGGRACIVENGEIEGGGL